MGLISKILHKDKHDDDPAAATATTISPDNTTTSQNKSYYTGPQTNTPLTDGHTSTATSGSHGLGSNTTSSGLGSTTGAHTSTSNTTAGPHSSSVANKADPRIDSDNSRFDPTSTTGRHDYASDNHGPHSSNTGNRVDPRVDSDNSRYAGGVSGSHGQFADTAASGHHGYERTPGAFPTGESGLGSNNTFTGHGSNTSGPHSSDLSNRADPRIDSDNSRHGHPSGLSSQPHVAGQNFSGRDPYSSTSSNTRDPLSSSHAPGPYGTREEYGSTGPASHTLGPHSSNAANVTDPRVHPEPEKMRDHKTGGPHQSDMLNKLDPRVDSDPRNHGYSSREPGHDDHRYGSTNSGSQTGGLVGGPHERLENPAAVPTAGGLPVGAEGQGIYDNSRSGLTGSHTRDPYESSHGGLTGTHGGLTGSHGVPTGSHGVPTGSHSGPTASSHGGLTGSHGVPTGSHSGLTGSHGVPTGSQSGLTGSHGGLTGSHNRDQYDSHARTNEPYSSTGLGGSHNIGSTGTTTGAYGSTNSGPHSSNVSNKADPRIDSDNDRLRGPDAARGNHGTSGPHNSDMLNKLDPRVDSDNSKAYGSSSHNTSSGLGSSTHNTGAGFGTTGTTSGHGAGLSGVGSGAGFGSGNHTTSSAHTGNHNALSDLEYKERELALRAKELDLKEREYRVNAGH